MCLLDVRLKFMTFLMLVVLAVSVTITVMRFGLSPLWADHFVPELSAHYQTSAMFAAFYGLLNFYVFTMAFVYSPSRNAIFGQSSSLPAVINSHFCHLLLYCQVLSYVACNHRFALRNCVCWIPWVFFTPLVWCKKKTRQARKNCSYPFSRDSLDLGSFEIWDAESVDDTQLVANLTQLISSGQSIDQVQQLLKSVSEMIYCAESHFKDNPALSMLNDSDDDVVYGWVICDCLVTHLTAEV